MELKQLIITDQGRKIMADALDGKGTIQYSRIDLSSASVADIDIPGMTAMSDVMQTAPVSGVTRESDTSLRITAAIDNADLVRGYDLRSIGLYAWQGAGTEILYAVAGTASPGYMPPYSGVSSSGIIIHLTLAVSQDMGATVDITAADTATAADIVAVREEIADVSRRIIRPNMLDNWYLCHPINQRKATSGDTDWAVTVDRWRTFGATWRLTDDGLLLSCRHDADYWSVLQQLDLPPGLIGQTVTTSVLLDGSLVTGSTTLQEGTTVVPLADNERIELHTDSGQGTLVWQYYGTAKPHTIQAVGLEVGEGQTLAHLDSTGKWIVSALPERMDHLLRCQRYYCDCTDWSRNHPCCVNHDRAAASVITPVPMAATPTIRLTQPDSERPYGVIYGVTAQVQSLQVASCHGNHVSVELSIPEGSTVTSGVWRECLFVLDTEL